MDFTRRRFLQATGGLVAASSLPALADDPSVFPARGGYERLVLAYQRIDAGATAPFSILHISDTHLTAAYPNEADAADKAKSMKRRTRTSRARVCAICRACGSG